MSTLPTLYKYDSQKRLRFWKVSIIPNNDLAIIHIEHGMDGGKTIAKDTPIYKGKGNRNALEQALSEAKSKYNAKINKEGYLPEKPSADHFIPRPMLAKTYTLDDLKKKKPQMHYPMMVQKKYDGIRCIAHNGELKSRQMKPILYLDNLAIETQKLCQLIGGNIYLDGEIYHHEVPFGEIQGFCNSNNTKKLSDEKKLLATRLQYYIYDFFDRDNMSLIYSGRYKILQSIFEKNAFTQLKLAPTEWVKDVDEMLSKHAEYTAENYEGIILRNPAGPYEINKRSKYLQKYKSFHDTEYPIVDFKSADNDYWVDEDGNLNPVVTWICRTPTGKTFSVKHKAPKRVQHEFFLDGGEYVGGLLTVMYQELTPDGVPRFPVGKEIRDWSG